MSIKKTELEDLIEAGTTEASYSPEGTNADGTVNVNLPDDIRAIGYEDPPKKTLGDWLADQTEKNEYGPSGGLTVASKMQGATEPPPINTAGDDSGARVFFNDVLEDAASYFEGISKGGTPDTRTGGTFDSADLLDLLDKNDGSSGNTLLGDIPGDALNTAGTQDYGDSSNNPVKEKISSVLKYNRFSPGGSSPYIQDQQYSKGPWSEQKTFGEYKDDGKTPTLQELAKVGLSLMLRATGDNTDPDSANSTKAIGQGIDVQLALAKTKQTELNVSAVSSDVMGLSNTGLNNTTMYTAGIRRKGSKTEPLEAEHAKSWGQLNSYLEPWGGPLPIAMIVLAVLAALATLVAGVVIGLLLDLIFLLFPAGEEEMPGEVFPMGAAPGKKDFGTNNIGAKILAYLGIPKLRSGKAFFLCMAVGVLRFYSRLLGTSASYYVVVSRAAIRDISQISDSMKDADFSNPVSFIESLFLIIDAFATSTTFQFLNTMAKLGDIVMLSGGLFGGGDLILSPYPEGKNSDLTAPDIYNLHTKSRTLVAGQENDDTRMSWRFGALPSAYLMPNGFDSLVKRKKWAGLQMSRGFTRGEALDGANHPGGYEKVKAHVAGARMDTADRMELEDILDASYMPFYFHDLRTNEIISFHAFLASVTDGFSPKWKEEEGFGRMDPVQIYQKTTRKIGLSFYVAATSKEDFDEMWFAVNRLISMTYPQWSRGVQRKDAAGNTFIQPFSQMPTASPVIRMRLGELFKSNYSKMSLERLFGLATDMFMLTVDTGEANAEIREKMLLARDTAIADLANAELGPPPASEMIAVLGAIAAGLTPSPSQGYLPGMPVAINPAIGAKYPYCKATGVPGQYSKALRRFTATSAGPIEGGIIGYNMKPLIDLGDDDEKKAKKAKRMQKRQSIRYVFKPASPDFPLPDGMEGIIVDHSAIKSAQGSWIRAYIWKCITDAFAAGPTLPLPTPIPSVGNAQIPDGAEWFYAQEVSDWFSAENNAIVRSFESAGGQGLAGVINALDFDYGIEKTTWETMPGSRAPQAIKVTLGFAPIHDIPLGLDADGTMRAVAIPAGDLVRQLFGDPSREYGDEEYFFRQAQAARGFGQPLDEGEEQDSPPPPPGS